MSIVKIENVRVLDPIQKTDQVKTVYVENGKIVDSTWETDQFLVNAYIGCKVVRPLSRDGVPY